VAALLDEHPVDFIVDFSSETGIEAYGEEAAKRGVKIVSAASHYPESTVEYLQELSKRTVVFWSANITLGVNFIMYAAKFLKKIAPWADIKVSEEHFKEKKGISGTAKIIATVLDINEQDINTTRAGGIVGGTKLYLGSPTKRFGSFTTPSRAKLLAMEPFLQPPTLQTRLPDSTDSRIYFVLTSLCRYRIRYQDASIKNFPKNKSAYRLKVVGVFYELSLNYPRQGFISCLG